MRIIVNGVGGRMGQEVVKLAQSGYKQSEIVAGVDINKVDYGFPCFTSWDDVNVSADCIVDFSFHTATESMLNYATSKNIPVVLCTTGHTKEELDVIDNASKKIAIFRSANMSVGVALLVELAKNAVKAMPNADVEIVEVHHNRKLDAPSGTALMLANAIQTVRDKAELVFGRHGMSKREKNEIGVHSIRVGNVVGEHEVIIGTDNETITLKHEAHSRALFAEGALVSAEYIISKTAGKYDMQMMLKEN